MTDKIGSRVVETTEVMRIGNAPDEQYGCDCAACQEVGGLQFGNHYDAARALATHGPWVERGLAFSQHHGVSHYFEGHRPPEDALDGPKLSSSQDPR